MLINRMIPIGDELLLDLFTQDLKWGSATVMSLQRFGFSGANLYILQNAEGAGYPRVVKAGPTAPIRKERLAWRSIEGYFPEMGDVRYRTSSEHSRGALCFRLHTVERQSMSVLDLDSMYANALLGDLQQREQSIGHLATIYAQLESAHHPCSNQRAKTYASTYKWYLRSSTVPDRVGELFNHRIGPIEYCGYRVAENPLSVLSSLLRARTRGYSAHAIHGDLHLSNIVISESQPRTIDFAWARLDDHVIKDYVMMESSLRFMRFPAYIHPGAVLAVDSALNSAWDVEAARDEIPRGVGQSARNALNCMLDMVATVRRSVAKVATEVQDPSSDLMTEYLRSLYIVLAGQQRFGTFPIIRTAINLDQLASAVKAGL